MKDIMMLRHPRIPAKEMYRNSIKRCVKNQDYGAAVEFALRFCYTVEEVKQELQNMAIPLEFYEWAEKEILEKKNRAKAAEPECREIHKRFLVWRSNAFS